MQFGEISNNGNSSGKSAYTYWRNALTASVEINMQILSDRWSLFGYILRREFPQIKLPELILSLMVTNCKDDQRQPCQ